MGPLTGANGKKGVRMGSLLFLTLLAVLGVASPALGLPGDLDTSFGDDGMATGPDGSNFAEVALAPDGKLVAAGWNDADDIILSRYNQDGSPDTTFDGDGRAVVTVLQRPQVTALAIQPDGKIVVGGSKGWDYALDDDCEGGCAFLARYNADGSPDTTFSDDGKVAIPRASWAAAVETLAIQPDGKIVAAGSGQEADGSGNDYSGFALARFNGDGSPDTTFDGDGKLITPVSLYFRSVGALSVGSDGKLVAVGASAGEDAGLAVAHYNADGSLDGTFSGDGKLIAPTNGVHELEDYVIQPDGKIVAGGMVQKASDAYEEIGYDNDFALLRYKADGSPDTAFSGDGKVSTDLGTYDDRVKALALQPDGKIVAAGWSHDAATFDNMRLGLVRYTAGGSPDTAFSGDGKTFGKILHYRELVLQRDGGIVAAGFTDERLPALSRHYGGDDATPPGPVTALTYTLGDHEISYSWTNPTNSDFAGVRILRSESEHASDPNPNFDQVKVYEGPGTSFTDTGLVMDPERYYYTVFAKDTSGNWSVAATTPQTEWYAAPMPVDKLPVEFYFRSPSDPGATFQCKIDDGTFSACSSPKEYTSLPDGPHTFYVRAKNAAGNVDPTPASFNWTVDTRKPVTTIESGPSGTISSGSARFTFSSDELLAYDPGYVCILDGAAYQRCESPMTYEGLGNGQHTFEVFADDPAGNRGLAATHTWTVAPEATSENLAPDATLTSDAENDGATADDPVETSITSPVGGATSVTETATVNQAEPANYSFLGQQANITTPPSTAERPLRFEFRLDSSLVPEGETANTVQVFRNGVMVEDCTDGTSPVAAPDPCVLGRQLDDDGDVRFTVLTSAASRWNFGVFDDAPKVTSVTPAHLAKNASARTNVTATFSEAMNATTIDTSTFVLVKRGTATPIAARVVYSDTTRKATLNPKRDLKPGATYTATIRGGATGAADATGNALADDRVWTFTVKKR